MGRTFKGEERDRHRSRRNRQRQRGHGSRDFHSFDPEPMQSLEPGDGDSGDWADYSDSERGK